jgi:hypothetical protein
MSLIPIFNKNSPQAHTESELGMIGVHGKLVKYVIHSFKRKNFKKTFFFSHKLSKQQSTSFWSQRILGVKSSHMLRKVHSRRLCKNKMLNMLNGNKTNKNKKTNAPLIHILAMCLFSIQ